MIVKSGEGIVNKRFAGNFDEGFVLVEASALAGGEKKNLRHK